MVTGGASGIGRALCERFAAMGAAKVVVADLNTQGAEAVSHLIDGDWMKCDVSVEADIARLIEATERRHGSIDLFCSNAGIAAGFEPNSLSVAFADDAVWQKSWLINVMAHVYAARQLLPGMIARGSGYFLNTVSAAGLLTQLGSAVYSTTKHASVGFAESLAIAHRKHGVRVSVLCPQGVDTPMLQGLPQGPQSRDGVMTAADVALAAANGVEEERFLILPHPQVSQYMNSKVNGYDRWIAGMAKLQDRY